MISLCIPAYNEAKNLGRLLERVSAEPLIDEIVVVASGCTDNTAEIALSYAPRVKLYVQETREGKASAINLFLRSTVADIIILESADTLPGPLCFSHLLKALADETVGMVGARPVPVATPGLVGVAGQILWGVHHELALKRPKLGELVAFRRLFDQLPSQSSVDEASIESEVVKRGYRLAYAPDATAFNKAPQTWRDLWKQRRRIAKGHRALATQGYSVASNDTLAVGAAAWRVTPKTPRGIAALATLTSLEITARLQARWGKHGTEETVWEISESTKSILEAPSSSRVSANAINKVGR